MTRVKICGITRPEDAALAADLGADAIGLNFVGGPRKLTVVRAFQILQATPVPIERVALIDANVKSAPVSDELDNIGTLDVTTAQVYNYNLTNPIIFNPFSRSYVYWMVRHIGSRQSLTPLSADWAKRVRGKSDGCLVWVAVEPAAILLDTASGRALGGTGESFDWNWIADARAARELDGLPQIILAGGLNPDNVSEAIRIAQPYAVDVSSGVEVAGKPGIKDPIKMRDFIQAAKGA